MGRDEIANTNQHRNTMSTKDFFAIVAELEECALEAETPLTDEEIEDIAETAIKFDYAY